MSEGLRRFTAPRPPGPRPGERCEMCAEPIGAQHSHVVDLESRAITCTCRACYLLFTRPGAGRFRAVPERYRYTPDLVLDHATWDSIGIPVRMVFVFTNSIENRPVAFYPSPAGATESLLPMQAWTGVLADNPALADAEPDVEALLINAIDDADGTRRFECFLVPIDECYALVGLVRLRWKGFDGGADARREIAAFFDRLRDRSEQVEVADG